MKQLYPSEDNTEEKEDLTPQAQPLQSADRDTNQEVEKGPDRCICADSRGLGCCAQTPRMQPARPPHP